MWFLPSRRSHLIERVFSVAPPAEPGIIIVNEPDVDAYRNLKIPDNWKIHAVKDCRFYRDKVNKAFDDFPNEPYYGILGDDMVPETPGWDAFLAWMAGKKNIAGSSQVYIKGRIGAGAVGGDLVRTCGWLCCPAVKHFYSDDVYELIGAEFKCITIYDHIRIAHHHFSVGMAPFDTFYQSRSDADDKGAYERWKREEWPGLKEKLAPLYRQ